MYLDLTLYAQAEITIDKEVFMKKLLKLYRPQRPLGIGHNFNDEICSVVKKMTGVDPYDYDNAFRSMQTLMKNVIEFATDWHRPQTEIDMLNEILDLMCG